MALTLEYPDNWAEIATTVKQAAGYRCNHCGLKCLPPHNSYRHLDLSLRRKLSAQVHHLDGKLSLKLKLPKVRRPRQNKQNWQLTLTDLIDRLPQLPLILHRQLELDLSIIDTCFTTEV
jgi:hypothetical protein